MSLWKKFFGREKAPAFHGSMKFTCRLSGNDEKDAKAIVDALDKTITMYPKVVKLADHWIKPLPPDGIFVSTDLGANSREMLLEVRAAIGAELKRRGLANEGECIGPMTVSS